jgi:tight adherence protein C
MREAAALLAGMAVFLFLTGRRPAKLVERVGTYLGLRVLPRSSNVRPSGLRQAGLGWDAGQHLARRLVAGGCGAFVGLLLAQGDLLLTGPGRSAPGLGVAGTAAGVLGLNMWVTTRREHRAESLRQELPSVADGLALQVVAGESVATAIEHYTREAQGVAAQELAGAVDAYREGQGLAEALSLVARQSAHTEAARLYQLLGQAHQTGGRLVEALAELATDYRAALARELTAEGGRRALAVYGPILALMIPVTVLFLMYPTLVGLRQLAGSP